MRKIENTDAPRASAKRSATRRSSKRRAVNGRANVAGEDAVAMAHAAADQAAARMHAASAGARRGRGAAPIASEESVDAELERLTHELSHEGKRLLARVAAAFLQDGALRKRGSR